MTEIKQILLCHIPEDGQGSEKWLGDFARSLQMRLGNDFSVKRALPRDALSGM